MEVRWVGTGKRRAVFLDRDGTINEDRGYIGDPEDVALIAYAAEAIKKLNEQDIPVIVITNQSGIGRGYYGEAELKAVNKRFEDLLLEYEAHIEGLYYCPHLPTEGCECRKPATRLINEAANDHDIDLKESVMVGDKVSDMELGQRAGMKSVLVLTGYGPMALEEIKQGTGGRDGLEGFTGFGGAGRGLSDLDYVAEDLAEAVEWMLSADGPLGSGKGQG